jgi:hypothetical protein
MKMPAWLQQMKGQQYDHGYIASENYPWPGFYVGYEREKSILIRRL